MRLTPNKVTLASGKKLVNGYKIMLPKLEVENFFKAGDEFVAEFKKDRIILKLKKEPSK